MFAAVRACLFTRTAYIVSQNLNFFTFFSNIFNFFSHKLLFGSYRILLVRRKTYAASSARSVQRCDAPHRLNRTDENYSAHRFKLFKQAFCSSVRR